MPRIITSALAFACLLPLAFTGCVKSVPNPSYSGPPKAFKLLDDTPEDETTNRPEKRTDLYVTVDTGEPIPAVVATGEVTSFNRQGGAVRLYGDAAGKEGWYVDNFLFIEVVDSTGVVIRRAAIGYQLGVNHGPERVDTLGQNKFSFAPGEIDLSLIIPAHETVTLRVTALDSGGVGKVSDVYAILTAEAGAGSDEELKDH